ITGREGCFRPKKGRSLNMVRVGLPKDFKDRCPQCNQIVSFSNRYDSFVCNTCDLWLEDRCTDWACEFCRFRPSHPAGAKDLIEAKPMPIQVEPLNPEPVPRERFVIIPPKITRNQSCPCGSGKKYKKCCSQQMPSEEQRPQVKQKPDRRGEHALSRF